MDPLNQWLNFKDPFSISAKPGRALRIDQWWIMWIWRPQMVLRVSQGGTPVDLGLMFLFVGWMFWGDWLMMMVDFCSWIFKVGVFFWNDQINLCRKWHHGLFGWCFLWKTQVDLTMAACFLVFGIGIYSWMFVCFFVTPRFRISPGTLRAISWSLLDIRGLPSMSHWHALQRWITKTHIRRNITLPKKSRMSPKKGTISKGMASSSAVL